MENYDFIEGQTIFYDEQKLLQNKIGIARSNFEAKEKELLKIQRELTHLSIEYKELQDLYIAKYCKVIRDKIGSKVKENFKF